MELLVAAVLVGAALQSATGFGFAQVSSPAVFHALDPDAAVTVVALLSLVLSLLVLYGERRAHEVRRREVAGLVAWAVPGLAVGVVVLGALGKPTLQIGVGVAVVAAVAVDELAARAGSPSAARPLPAAPIGFLTGGLSITTGINGPPLLIWFGRRGATPGQTRDSLAACFVLLSLGSLLVLLAAGRLDLGRVTGPWLAVLLVAIAVGRPAGRAVFLRLDRRRFRVVGLGVAVAAGLASIAAGALA